MSNRISSTFLVLFDCIITLLCIKDCIQCCKDDNKSTSYTDFNDKNPNVYRKFSNEKYII